MQYHQETAFDNYYFIVFMFLRQRIKICLRAMSERRKSLSQRFKEQLLGDTFQKIYHVFCRIVWLSTFVVQFAILDVYLVLYKNLYWCLWIIPDLLVLGTFIAAAVRSFIHLEQRSAPVKKLVGELPLSYIAWFLYSAILSAKFCIIYVLPNSIASQLDEKNFFGPNMLQTGLSLVSIILYFFILTVQDTRAHTEQNNYIQSISGSTYVDLLDAVSFGSVLLKDKDVVMGYHLDWITMAIVSFNFVLPSECLFVLSKTYFGKFPLSHKSQLIHKVVHYVVVNFPMFLVRMLVWHLHDQNISVFLVKNILALTLAVKDIHDFTIQMTKVITDSPDGLTEEETKVGAADMELKGNLSEMQILSETAARA